MPPSRERLPPLCALLINDDGPDSPLLPAFAAELRKRSLIRELRIVVPDANRSWISGAVTRSGTVKVTEREIAGAPAYLLSGTPADCASIGIFNLFPTPPDVVISGPNIGRNSGLPFSMSSGTLGGALLAGLSGVNAVALSIKFPKEIHRVVETNFAAAATGEWQADWQRLGAQMASLAELVLERKLHDFSRVINVNAPWSTSPESHVRLTRLRNGRYGRLFKLQDDGSFRHSDFELDFDPLDETIYTDEQCLEDECVSITPINPLLMGSGLSPEREHDLVSRIFG